MYVDLRMATTASRDYLTPYEMIKGERPFIDHIRPFFTTSHVHVSKERRQKLKKLGLSTRRAEVGNLLGFDSPFSTTYSVLLDQNRLVRSRSVTFEIGSYNSMERRVSAPKQNVSGAPELEVSLPSKGVQPIDFDEEDSGLMPFSGNEDASEDDDLEDLFQNSPVIEIENEDFEAYDNPAQEPGTPLADCAPSEEEESPESEGLNGNYWNSSGLSSRPRNADPQYVFMAQIRALNDLADQYDLFDRKLDKDLESKTWKAIILATILFIFEHLLSWLSSRRKTCHGNALLPALNGNRQSKPLTKNFHLWKVQFLLDWSLEPPNTKKRAKNRLRGTFFSTLNAQYK